MFEQRVPHEGCFGEAVQEYQGRPATSAGGAAAQGDAVRQGLLELFDHSDCGWAHCQSSKDVSSTPCFFRAENSFTSPPPACSRAMDSALAASLRLSLSALVNSRNFSPCSTRGRITSSRMSSSSVSPCRGSHISTTARRFSRVTR